MPDYKKEAAKAALSLLRKDSTVGFGAGSTIKYLIDFIKEDTGLASSMTTLSSSFSTRKLLRLYGFKTQDIADTKKIDLYFDGCDQFDYQLNAIKSGGGIHTMEKLLAAMAGEFILLGDESKYADKLDATYPLVLEVIPEAISFVLYRLKEMYSFAEATIRMSTKKDGAIITEHGNYLVDVLFPVLPDPGMIDASVSSIPGVLAHSLFYKMAHKAVVAGVSGVRIILQPPGLLIAKEPL